MIGSEQRWDKEGLVILVSKVGGSATMKWQGTSDARDPSQFLEPLVEQWTTELTGLNVALDFTGVEYMNSATLSPLLCLIRGLDPTNHEVVVRFASDDWQLAFQRCVQSLARTLKHVRIEVPSTDWPAVQ